jgi:SAM-dependent methyltransferase
VPRDIDILTAPGLKHLRDRWWDAAFNDYIHDTLQPQSGDQVLEVGCGSGLAELTLGLLEPGRVRYVGIDRQRARVQQANRAARDRGLSLGLAAAEAGALPFRDGAFASALCVGVLQHAGDPGAIVRDLARVTQTHGRVLLVEPDNAARYWYSALPSGMQAFALSQEFLRTQFAAMAAAGTDAPGAPGAPDLAIGPHVADLCRANGIDPIAVHVFPVSSTRLGAPVPTVWQARREAIARLVAEVPQPQAAIRSIGEAWLRALEQYAADSAQAGPAFLEIQHTMLVATVGQVRARAQAGA